MNIAQINEKLDVLKKVAQAMRYNNLQNKYNIMIGFLIVLFIIILASMFFEKWEFVLTGLLAYVGAQIEMIKVIKLKTELVSSHIEKEQLSKLKKEAEDIVEVVKQFVGKEDNGFDQDDKILKMLIRDRLSDLSSEIGAIIYLYCENKDKFEVSLE